MIMRAERLLLDTHVVVWMTGDTGRSVPTGVRRAVDRASAAGRLHVSAISGWEIGNLVARNRLHLGESVWAWFRRAISMPGLRALDVTPDIAVEAAVLPGDAPRDPADRILIATARCRRLTLVTADQEILAYASDGHVRALEAG